MKTSELIKQLKELKESFKASERQIDADKKVYDKMQYIAGILNEEESDSEEIPDGTKFFVQSQGLTDTGRGTVTDPYVVVGKEGDLYKVVSQKDYENKKLGFASTMVGNKPMTADYIKNHRLFSSYEDYKKYHNL